MQYISKGCGKSYILGPRNQMSLRYFYEPSKQMIACDAARGENSDESQPENFALGARHSLGGEGPIYSQLWMCLDRTFAVKRQLFSKPSAGLILNSHLLKSAGRWYFMPMG